MYNSSIMAKYYHNQKDYYNIDQYKTQKSKRNIAISFAIYSWKHIRFFIAHRKINISECDSQYRTIVSSEGLIDRKSVV